MKTKLNFKLLLLVLIGSGFVVKAQTPAPSNKREIGVRLSGLNNFDFIFKKQRAENSYKRIRLISANLSVMNQQTVNSQLGMGLAIGREKRSELGNSLKLLKGWEAFGNASMSYVNDNAGVNLLLGMGLVLGVQYDINDKFLVNLETIPVVSVNMQYNSNNFRFGGVNAGFNSSSVALGVLYKF